MTSMISENVTSGNGLNKVSSMGGDILGSRVPGFVLNNREGLVWLRLERFADFSRSLTWATPKEPK